MKKILGRLSTKRYTFVDDGGLLFVHEGLGYVSREPGRLTYSSPSLHPVLWTETYIDK
jgi:hypothetical protein